MNHARGQHPGPLSDEAAKLFAAAHEWLGDRMGKMGERVAMGSTECQLCPVCQLIGLMRAAQPEAVEHLADASLSLLAAFRALLETHERQWAGHRSDRNSPDVERIDIG
jgi:hypothetical protein